MWHTGVGGDRLDVFQVRILGDGEENDEMTR